MPYSYKPFITVKYRVMHAYIIYINIQTFNTLCARSQISSLQLSVITIHLTFHQLNYNANMYTMKNALHFPLRTIALLYVWFIFTKSIGSLAQFDKSLIRSDIQNFSPTVHIYSCSANKFSNREVQKWRRFTVYIWRALVLITVHGYNAEKNTNTKTWIT